MPNDAVGRADLGRVPQTPQLPSARTVSELRGRLCAKSHPAIKSHPTATLRYGYT
jgi:hypothetical protein